MRAPVDGGERPWPRRTTLTAGRSASSGWRWSTTIGSLPTGEAFARTGRFALTGVAHRVSEVPALLRGRAADVVLVDFALPDGRGSEALRLISRAWPRARLVYFSGSTDPATLDEAIAAGAEGVLSKARGIDEVLAMIERAHLGDVLLDPELLREMAFRSPSTSAQTPRAESLTRRERAVLEALLASGRTTVAAEQLGIAAATVRVHVHRACAKLGARTRLEAVSRALRSGLIDPPAG